MPFDAKPFDAASEHDADPLPFDGIAAPDGVPPPDGIAEPPAAYGGTIGGNVAVYGVGQIATYVRELLDTDPFLTDIWIAGEVTNLSRSQAGHIYFTCSDAGGALRCVFFRQHNLGLDVEQGTAVLIHGRASLYPERGDLQFYVDALQPEGIGVQQAEFRRLFERLKAEGLFETARKRTLPHYPRNIGVVTSPTGAVWHDIQTVTERRWPMSGLLLSPAQVQGDAAPRSIVAAIERLNEVAESSDDVDLDLIVVARGGGSAEDLWAFNDERVARAIFASAVPIVSAIGHETDYTIADYVADLRAATPSAAAELVVPDRRQEESRVAALALACGAALDGWSDRARSQVSALLDRLESRGPDFDAQRVRIDRLLAEAESIVATHMQSRRGLIVASQARLQALNPRATLARGYAIVQDDQGRIVERAGQLTPDDAVRIQFDDGLVDARVVRIERE